jgi:DNA-binding NtrC family response regulator
MSRFQDRRVHARRVHERCAFPHRHCRYTGVYSRFDSRRRKFLRPRGDGMLKQLRLLMVDADIGFVHAIAEPARAAGFELTIAGSLAQAVTRVRATRFDLVLLDLALPDGSGLDLLEHLDLTGATDVVLMTAHASVHAALKGLHLPVLDYMVKPVEPLPFRRLLEAAALRHRVVVDQSPWRGFAGRSAHVRNLRADLCRVARTDAAVLLHGESGVGKELAAEAVHAESGRSGDFVAVNCGAVPPDLLTSQLFGHEKGSFTGATNRHLGLFQQADGGTLFLDEIAEMPAHLQVHLLRALETHRIRRVGGHEDIPVDVRIVAATNRPLERARLDGRLRDDLYYRLAEFPLRLAPLRERPEDILPIAELLLARFDARDGVSRSFAPGTEAALCRYPWPGNVRELKNAVQRACILADGPVVRPEPGLAGSPEPLHETASTITFAVGTSLAEIERRMLFKTLAHFDDNKVRAAEALGITTKTIYNRLAAYQSEDRALSVDDTWPDDAPITVAPPPARRNGERPRAV